MPYRVDVARTSDAVLDRLVALGALDVDRSHGGGIVALMPDGVTPEQVARALGLDGLSISPAVGRDAESIWILAPRAIRIGRLRIVPADASTEPGALRLTDSAAFGTGLHPTTAIVDHESGAQDGRSSPYETSVMRAAAMKRRALPASTSCFASGDSDSSRSLSATQARFPLVPSLKSDGTNVCGSAGSVRSASCRGVSRTSGGGSTRARDHAIWEDAKL